MANEALSQRANEVQAARDAVVQAARLANDATEALRRDNRRMNETHVYISIDCLLELRETSETLKVALATLDALQAEPPEGESAESELPPRGVAWREMMARVDHEGGC